MFLKWKTPKRGGGVLRRMNFTFCLNVADVLNGLSWSAPPLKLSIAAISSWTSPVRRKSSRQHPWTRSDHSAPVHPRPENLIRLGVDLLHIFPNLLPGGCDFAVAEDRNST